ncbi:hypothetical protein GCM10009665_80420 [Kitasatospora nipponensis]|uniref:Uncharacterized protein n=1 Tax=Kitasatospora nipponensis TaxID=258049 RepID=A0ABP4DZW9_9ACTN
MGCGGSAVLPRFRGPRQDWDCSGCPDCGMSGAGDDWGRRLGSEYLVGALGSEDVHVLLNDPVGPRDFSGNGSPESARPS